MLINGPGNSKATPEHTLDIEGNDGATKLQIKETNGTATVRTMYELINNGSILFRMQSTAPNGPRWVFGLGSAGFLVSNSKVSGVQAQFRNNGDLDLQGVVNENSSRAVKANLSPVDSAEILERVNELPITTWNYNYSRSNLHLGPMAEDFYAAFGLGPDDKHIAPKDLAGVALAAIQALSAENAGLEAQNRQLEARISALEELVSKLAD